MAARQLNGSHREVRDALLAQTRELTAQGKDDIEVISGGLWLLAEIIDQGIDVTLLQAKALGNVAEGMNDLRERVENLERSSRLGREATEENAEET